MVFPGFQTFGIHFLIILSQCKSWNSFLQHLKAERVTHNLIPEAVDLRVTERVLHFPSEDYENQNIEGSLSPTTWSFQTRETQVSNSTAAVIHLNNFLISQANERYWDTKTPTIILQYMLNLSNKKDLWQPQTTVTFQCFCSYFYTVRNM